MRILFLSAWCPLPADNGAKLRVSHLLRGLTAQHAVDLLCFAPDIPDRSSLQELHSICKTVRLIQETPFAGRKSGRLLGFLSSKPRSVVANHSAAMEAAVRAWASRGYDLVIASQVHMAPYALLLSNIPRILEEVELAIIHDQYVHQTEPLRRMRAYLTWLKTYRYVQVLLGHFVAATVASAREEELVRPLMPRTTRLVVVPNGVDVAAYSGNFGPPEQDVLIYPGAIGYHANFDAVDYFARAILPGIRACRPQVRFRVTGRVDAEQAAKLSRLGVECTGYLDDVRPAVAQAWAEVVPLRIGGGTRLKVLEALALGTPVISTSKGIEGLALRPGQNVLVADAPKTFVADTLRLLESEVLRQELALQGRRAAAGYDWSNSVERLTDLVADCALDAGIGRPLVSAAQSVLSPMKDQQS